MTPLFTRLAAAVCILWTAGCSTPAADVEPASEVTPERAEWHPVPLPGKLSTEYRWSHKDGRPALAAHSERSASMFRRKVHVSPADLGDVTFSWWIQDLVPGATVADAELSDAPARIMFGFDGDIAKLPRRTRMLFELAEALTGEKPPYATLMYVWDATAPVGSVIINGRSDRIRKIVVDSGPQHIRRWREHRRNLAADFRLAFGEEPGTLSSIAVMTDSDNTASKASSWYGPVSLH